MKDDVEDIPMVYLLYVLLAIAGAVCVAAVLVMQLFDASSHSHRSQDVEVYRRGGIECSPTELVLASALPIGYKCIWMQSVHSVQTGI
jgi:hypothetical protein